PTDLISTCVGINIYGGSTFNDRTFIPHVIGMIKTLREGHPLTPLMVVSPISSPPRESEKNAVGMTLNDYRQQVKQTVQLVQQHDNDQHLFYHDGIQLFGSDLAHHMPDLLHPNGDGIHVLAKNYAKQIMPTLLNDLKSHAR
ncbi:MAG TPA: GDSL family lipase, partial [Phycisphaerales bacterium]|nr:GDSL family lipase [Phycisphaerales bacterium]